MSYKLKENMIYNVAYQVLSLLVPLVTTPYISRILGAAGVGQYSFTFSIVSLATTFATLGGDAHGNRTIAMCGEKVIERSKKFWGIFTVQCLSTLVASIFYFGYTFAVAEYRICLIWQGIHLLSSLFNINWYFYGRGQFKTMVIRNIVVKIVTLFSIFVFVKDKSDVVMYVAIMGLCNLLSTTVVWPKLLKEIKVVRITFSDVYIHVKPMLLLFTSVLAMSLYKKMDKVMIGYLSDVIQNGYYENVDRILQIPSSIIGAIGLVMVPQISNLIGQKKEVESIAIINKMMIIMAALSCAMCCGVFAVSGELVDVFFGNDFINCVSLMRLLSIVIIFQAVSNMIRSAYLIPHQKDGVYIKATIAGAIINIIVNWLLIRKLGAVGAGVGTILAEATVMVVQLFHLRDKLPLKKYFKEYIWCFIFGMVMATCVTLVTNILSCHIMIKLTIEVLIGILVYAVLFIVYDVWISKEKMLTTYMKK